MGDLIVGLAFGGLVLLALALHIRSERRRIARHEQAWDEVKKMAASTDPTTRREAAKRALRLTKRRPEK